MTPRRSPTTLDKLKILVQYCRCPGVAELGVKCGKPLGALSEIEFDHVGARRITGDDSLENMRPLCVECHKIKTTGRRGESKLSVSKDGDVQKIAKIRRRDKCLGPTNSSPPGGGSSLTSERPKPRWPKRKLQSRNNLRRTTEPKH